MAAAEMRLPSLLSVLAGQQVPQALIDRFEPISGDPAAVRAEGIEVATELASRLIPEGIPSLHFYTLNRSRSTRAVLENLGIRAPLSVPG